MGKEYFIEQLNEFAFNARYFPSTFLPNPYYWAGNEEDLFSLWMFSYAGRPGIEQLNKFDCGYYESSHVIWKDRNHFIYKQKDLS